MRTSKRWKIFIVIPVALFCISAVVIVWDGLTNELQLADVALVMGAKVEVDGMPSRRLQARLDTALELYGKGLFERLIVSGGFGWEGYDEAEVMRDYLIERGVPAESIIIDNDGNDTYSTAKSVSRIMEANGMESVLVVTQHFHIPRTKLALGRFGVSRVYSANANYWGPRDLYYIPREVVAYYYYLVRSYE